ncbi:aspartate/glutamate racemase family protein [candidate division KSB1 bacterium]|nr:aspartate/glutamate racemase family protein [candidate division KSB1 bacterium]
MEYAYSDQTDLQGKRLSMPRQSIAGHAIGIVVLETWYPLLPGNVANATTFHFPVRYKILREATVNRIMSADPDLIDMIIQAGREFQQEGIRAMVGACGYFANYQKIVSQELEIPVFLSSLLQVPMIYHALKPGQQVGMLVANAKAVNSTMLEACGITPDIPIAYLGMEDQPEFRNILEYGGQFHYDRFKAEVVGRAQQLVVENPNIGALLLECSDLPPFAWHIHHAVKLPVLNFISMINWIYHGVVQCVYRGFF